MTAKPPRQRKTHAQRAAEALGIEQRRVDALLRQRSRLEDELDAVRQELVEATARRDHLADHPDLKSTTRPSTPGTTNGSGDTA